MRRLLAIGTAVGGGVTVGRLLVRGALTLDVGVGRSLRPLGPVSFEIAAPPDVVFDVISEPYLGRRPQALKEKLEVWERGSDMVLAAHHTTARHRRTTTLETVRFERPTRVDFRLVRGPVPHVKESFELQPSSGGTRLTWQGELGMDFWAVGRWWAEKVGSGWEQAVRESVALITAEAERRAR
ncbi:MAG: SRPBCC family protein [Actinomycetota bacterium]